MHEDGRRVPLGEVPPPPVRPVQHLALRLDARDVGADDALVLGPDVLEELLPDGGPVEVDVAGEDEVDVLLAVVQFLDHVRQEAQHPTGALERRERAPLLVEDVDDLRVEGVRHLHLAPVLPLAGLRRQLLLVLLVLPT